jgi:hypothetical protein
MARSKVIWVVAWKSTGQPLAAFTVKWEMQEMIEKEAFKGKVFIIKIADGYPFQNGEVYQQEDMP